MKGLNVENDTRTPSLKILVMDRDQEGEGDDFSDVGCFPTRDDVFLVSTVVGGQGGSIDPLVGRIFCFFYIFPNTIGWIRCFYLSTSSNVNYPQSNLARHELEVIGRLRFWGLFLRKSTDRNLSGGISFFGLLHTELVALILIEPRKWTV